MTKYLEIRSNCKHISVLKGMVKVKPFTDNTNRRFDNLKKVYIR